MERNSMTGSFIVTWFKTSKTTLIVGKHPCNTPIQIVNAIEGESADKLIDSIVKINSVLANDKIHKESDTIVLAFDYEDDNTGCVIFGKIGKDNTMEVVGSVNGSEGIQLLKDLMRKG